MDFCSYSRNCSQMPNLWFRWWECGQIVKGACMMSQWRPWSNIGKFALRLRKLSYKIVYSWVEYDGKGQRLALNEMPSSLTHRNPHSKASIYASALPKSHLRREEMKSSSTIMWERRHAQTHTHDTTNSSCSNLLHLQMAILSMGRRLSWCHNVWISCLSKWQTCLGQTWSWCDTVYLLPLQMANCH